MPVWDESCDVPYMTWGVWLGPFESKNLFLSLSFACTSNPALVIRSECPVWFSWLSSCFLSLSLSCFWVVRGSYLSFGEFASCVLGFEHLFQLTVVLLGKISMYYDTLYIMYSYSIVIAALYDLSLSVSLSLSLFRSHSLFSSFNNLKFHVDTFSHYFNSQLERYVLSLSCTRIFRICHLSLFPTLSFSGKRILPIFLSCSYSWYRG